jgi:hypothetical protein
LKEAARGVRDGGRIIVTSTGETKLFFQANHFVSEAKALWSNSFESWHGNSA